MARLLKKQVERVSLSLLEPSTIPEVDSISSDLQATSHPICVVCMSNPRSHTLIPCGHMVVCHSCCSRLQKCPVCRAIFRGVVRTYVWLTYVWLTLIGRISPRHRRDAVSDCWLCNVDSDMLTFKIFLHELDSPSTIRQFRNSSYLLYDVFILVRSIIFNAPH